MDTKKPRRKRVDRMHLVYKLVAPDQRSYIGITHRDGSARVSLERRWMKHVYRGRTEVTLPWPLYVAMRSSDVALWTREILEVVRGKDLAHEAERIWIAKLNPQLNKKLS